MQAISLFTKCNAYKYEAYSRNYRILGINIFCFKILVSNLLIATHTCRACRVLA